MKPLDFLEVYADAEFYDQEFAGRAHEIPFFVEQAQMAQGPVLEVGCGTGRITLPIARAGVEISGLEISRPMLELARGKAKEQGLAIAWMHRDCRDIGCKNVFALIFSATNAMQHLLDLDSVNSFLKSARAALRPGGKLILDVFNPDVAKLARKAGTRYLHKTLQKPDGGEIQVEAETEYHATTQILGFTLYYLRRGELVRTKRITMRCFFPEELLGLCRFNGFEVEKRFGNYGGSQFVDDSPKQILICQICL